MSQVIRVREQSLGSKCNHIINEISESGYSEYRYEEIVSKYNLLKKEYMVILNKIA